MGALTRIISIILVAILISCGTLKDVGRTINDAALIVCEIFATENKDRLEGFSPQQWCAIHKNIAPFIDEILAAKKRAGLKHEKKTWLETEPER